MSVAAGVFQVLVASTAIVLLPGAGHAGDEGSGTIAEIECVGDCDGDGTVTINELITGVNIALGSQVLGWCPFFDWNGDGRVTVDELIRGVTNALTGCGPPAATHTASPTGLASSTPTASATATATGGTTPTTSATRPASSTPTATATRTPGGTTVQQAVAGGSAAAVNAMSVIPSIVTAIASGYQYAGASFAVDGAWAAAADPRGTGSCPAGGTATRTGSIPGSMSITLTNCGLQTSDGFLVLNGTVSLTGLLVLDAIVDVQVTFTDAARVEKLVATADLRAQATPQLGPPCNVTGATLAIGTGSVSSQVPADGGVTMTFDDTTVAVSVATFNDDCVPLQYSMTFDGPATLSITPAALAAAAVDPSMDVRFSHFTVSQNATQSPVTTDMNGMITSECWGGAVTLTTLASLTQRVGEPCPNGGKLEVASAAAGTSWVLYTAGGAVAIDANRDGVSEETYPSCLDPALLMCVGPAPATPTHTATAASPTSSATHTSTPPTPAPTATATRTGTWTATPLTPAPTGTATRTETATATVQASPTASATATSSGVLTATATPTPSTTPTPTSGLHLYERVLSPPLEIYDDDPYGVFDDLHLTDTAVIDELAVGLDIRHTWVGDLVVTLTHWNTGREVVLLNRPGYPALSSYGCGGDDVLGLINDDATVACEDLCSETPAAIGGQCFPTQPLNSFAGESLAGTWSLAVADVDATETGVVVAWSLGALARPRPTPGGPSAPEVLIFTCRGEVGADVHLCWLTFSEPFTLTFTFADADGDADGWIIWAVREDGAEFLIDQQPISPPSGGATIERYHPTGFTCPGFPCPTTYFDIYLVVTDASGRESLAAHAGVVVYAPYLVTGEPAALPFRPSIRHADS